MIPFHRLHPDATLPTRGSERAAGLERSSPTLRHGHNRRKQRSTTYQTWVNMRARVKPDGQDSIHYHKRSISICERWSEFENFLADMGEKPRGLTLDRIDVNGNYEPGNCRWATWAQQQNNRTDNHMLVVRGETMTLREAATRYALNYNTLRSRIYMLGLGAEEAIFTPCRGKGGNPARHPVRRSENGWAAKRAERSA